MAKIRCPSCQRAFTVKPEMSGRRTRCPGCSTPFVIPQVATDPPPSAPAPAPPPPPVEPDSPFAGVGEAGPGSAFAFDDPPGGVGSLDFSDGSGSVVARSRCGGGRLQSAAFYLNLLVFLSLGWFVIAGAVGTLQSRNFNTVIGLLCLSPVYGVPLVFVWLGARHLENRRSWGLALTGVLFAALCVLVYLGLGALGLLAAVLAVARGAGPGAAAAIPAVPALVIAALGATGAVKGFLALMDGKLAASFASSKKSARAEEVEEAEDHIEAIPEVEEL